MSTAISSMTIFELVRPFAEADDPKLRGNAVHAYAALLESPEENVRRQARDELLALVSQENGSESEAAAMRHFAPRALDAFVNLPPAELHLCESDLLKRAKDGGTEPAQRRAAVRFCLTLRERHPAAWDMRWWEVQQLLWSGGRPGLASAVWAAAWRVVLACLLAYVGILTYADLTPLDADPLWTASLLVLLGSGALSIGLVSGRFLYPLNVHVVDAAICGAIFGATSAAATYVDDGDPSPAGPIVAFVLGFLMGAVLRGRRWAWNHFRGSANAPYFSVVGALSLLGVATLLCLGATGLGAPSGSVGRTWLILLPMLLVGSSLDDWLAFKGPAPLLSRTGRLSSRTAQAIALTQASIAVGAACIWWITVVGTSLPRSVVATLPSANLPESLDSSGSLVVPLRIGQSFQFKVSEEMPLKIQAIPGVPSQRLKLVISAPMEVEDPPPILAQQPGESLKEDWILPKGAYSACISLAEYSIGCGEPTVAMTFGEIASRAVKRPTSAKSSTIRPRLELSRGQSEQKLKLIS